MLQDESGLSWEDIEEHDLWLDEDLEHREREERDPLNPYSEEEMEILLEVDKEIRSLDPVYSEVTLHTFVSKSKGRGRKRTHWKEVELIKYGYNYHLPHKFDWYIASLELLGVDDEQALKDMVLGNQRYNMNTRRR